MSNITMQEFEKMIEESYALKSQIDVKEAEMKELSEQLRHKQTQILTVMQTMDKSSYKSKFGTVVRMQRFTVPTPKDLDDKKAFFDYLKSKGVYDQMITVNSQTLNAWYKQELEVARAENRSDVFGIPGLKEPTYSEYLTLRK